MPDDEKKNKIIYDCISKMGGCKEKIKKLNQKWISS